MEAAKRHGAVVSFDCNYRPSLWKSARRQAGRGGGEPLLMPFVDVLFGHEGDVAATLCDASHGPRVAYAGELCADGEACDGGVSAAQGDREYRTRAAYGEPQRTGVRLDMQKARPMRGCGSMSWRYWTAWAAATRLRAGLIYGLLQGKGAQWSLDCGVAHGALAMTTAGD